MRNRVLKAAQRLIFAAKNWLRVEISFEDFGQMNCYFLKRPDVIIDDLYKQAIPAFGLRPDPQAECSDSELSTMAKVSSYWCSPPGILRDSRPEKPHKTSPKINVTIQVYCHAPLRGVSVSEGSGLKRFFGFASE
jgi:hypothetical protein